MLDDFLLPTSPAVQAGQANPYSSASVDNVITEGFTKAKGDDRLRGAYLTAAQHVNQTGLPGFDTYTLWRTTAEKAVTIGEITMLGTHIRSPYIMARQAADQPGVNRTIRSALARQSIDWNAPSVQAWANQVAQDTVGQNAELVITGLKTMLLQTHAPELGIDSRRLMLGEEDLPIINQHFKWLERKGPITVAGLMKRLRRDGVALHYRHADLDARADNMQAALQVSLAHTFLLTLGRMVTIGGASKDKARQLDSKFGGHVLGDDYHGKLAMLGELGDWLIGFAERGRGKETERQLVGLLATGVALRRAYEDETQDLLWHVYDGMGYRHPEWLSAVHHELVAVDVAPPSPAKVAKQTPKSAEVASPAPDPIILEGLRDRAAELGVRADTYNYPWKIPRKSEEGLSGAIRSLTAPEGCVDREGTVLLSNMLRGDAKELVGVLRYLAILGGRESSKAQQDLQTVLIDYATLRDDIEILRSDALDQSCGGHIVAPQVVPIARHIDTLRTNWPKYRSVMMIIWPPEQVGTVIRNIEQLFNPTNPQA